MAMAGPESAAKGPAAADVEPRPLAFHTKVLFGIGSMEDGSQLIIVGGILLFYYSQILKAPVGLVSLVLGASLFVDAFFDLLVAQVSDNLRSPLGRRHPLMYASVLPVGLFFAAMWIPPAHLARNHLLLWLGVTVTLFRFSHSLYMVPSGSLLPELAPGYHDRTQLFGFRYTLGAIGGGIAAILAYGVFLHRTPAYPLGQFNPAGYAPLGVAIAAFIMSANLVSDLGTHSRIPYLYRPKKRDLTLGAWLHEIGSIFDNRNFLVSILGGMLSAVPPALIAGLGIYINTYIFSLPASNVMWLVASQALAAPVAFAMASLVSRRLGKRGAYLGFYAASLVFVHGPLVCRLLNILPANGTALLLPVLIGAQLIAGALSIAASILNTSMIADIVEDNQARTGRRSEGLVLFSERLILKLVGGLATVLPGILLALVHFPTGARPAHLEPAVTRNLAELYLGVSLSFSLMAMLVWLLFRIDHEVHQRNLAAVAARRAEEQRLER